MNIFHTSNCPIESAYNLCHRHVVKMILESAQILSTAHRVVDGDSRANELGLYKTAYKNHPSNTWCRNSNDNYKWLYSHFKALCSIYRQSSGKVHATEEKLLQALSEAPRGIHRDGLTRFHKCMPDNIAGMYSDPVKCYQKYITIKYKEWLDRDKPLKVVYPLDNKPKWLGELSVR